MWCVNSYFKELFVLKVTFTLIFLKSFVTCLTYGFTRESYVFLVVYFCTGMYVRFFTYMFPNCSKANCAYGLLHKCSHYIFYAGIKIFSSLPLTVTVLKNDKAKFQAD